MSHRHGHAGAARGPGHDDAGLHAPGRAPGDRGRLLAAIALTAAVLVIEVVGGLRANYLALLADAGHMLGDLCAQGLALGALLLAGRPPDRRRTYGWYRVEILAALANGVTLMVASGVIGWSALARLREGAPEVHAPLALAVAALGLVANLAGMGLLRGAEGLNVRGAYLHLAQDALSSAAVLAGAAVLALRPGWRAIDPLLSLAIAVLLVVSALRLLRETVGVLLEAAPTSIDVDAVSRALSAERAVREVHDLHLWTITSGVYALSAHIVVDAGGGEQDALLGRIQRALADEFRIRHTTIQVESPAYRDGGQACVRCGE